MRILMLNYEYPPLGGGASLQTKELCEELAAAGIKVDVVTMHYKGLKHLESPSKNLKIFRVACLRSKKETCDTHEMMTFVISALAKAFTLNLRNRYNLIHAHFIIPTGVVAYIINKISRTPYILTSHGSDVPGFNPDRFQKDHRYIKPVWDRIVRSSKKIISPSGRLKSLLIKNSVSSRKITQIPIGYRIGPYSKRKGKNIIYVGRLFERKRVQDLIFACRNLPKGWRLIILGDGYYRKELEKQVSSLKIKNVKFAGWVDRGTLQKWYDKAAIAVMPSISENFSSAVVEGMMNGCATVVQACSAEVVGTSGIVYDDIIGLEKAIGMLTTDRKSLSDYQKKARERSLLYGWKNIRGKILEVYKANASP